MEPSQPSSPRAEAEAPLCLALGTTGTLRNALLDGTRVGLGAQCREDWLGSLNFKPPLLPRICVPRSRRRRPEAGRPTSLHSPHLRTGGGASTKTRMRTKALREAAVLPVAVAVTSTDWSSNVDPAPAHRRGGLDPFLLGTGWGPRQRRCARWGLREAVGAGPALNTGPSKGRKDGEEASGTPVLSLKGVQRRKDRGENQAPDTGPQAPTLRSLLLRCLSPKCPGQLEAV